MVNLYTSINHSEMTGLRGFFDGNIFCASDVGVPKPAPDLFLYAAEENGFQARTVYCY